MNKTIINKVAIKITLNIAMLALVGFMAILLTNIPMNLDFTRVNGKLVSNMDFSLYQKNVIESVNMLVSGKYLGQVVYGRGQMVKEIMTIALRRSMTLFFISLILAILLGIPKGIFDSRRNKKHSNIKLLQTLIPLSVPDVLTISLIQLFGLYLYKNKFTVLGVGPILYMGFDHWSQSIYPIIALSLVPAAYIARITATSIESVYHRDYILAARGKGCSEMRIILNHTMRDVFADLIASFSTIASMMFSSLFIVERIFYYPGITFELLGLYGNPSADGSTTIAYLTLAVSLAIIYFALYTMLEITKQILIPKLKN